MRKLIVIIAILFGSYCHAQIDSVYITLGRNDTVVSNFLNLLNSKKPNPSFSVEQGVTKNGNQTLKADFGLANEDFYKCRTIWCVFEEVKGQQYCTTELIHGDIKYANHYLSFLKANFTLVKENLWEKDFGDNNTLKMEAKFTKIGETFGIFFELKVK